MADEYVTSLLIRGAGFITVKVLLENSNVLCVLLSRDLESPHFSSKTSSATRFCLTLCSSL